MNPTIPAAGAYGVAVSPSGTTAYVTNVNGGTVSVISTATNTVTTTIAVGQGPWNEVAVSPDGATAYVTNYGSNTVSVINTATNTVTTTIAVGQGPQNVAFSPNGTTAYVVNRGSGGNGTVSVISTGYTGTGTGTGSGTGTGTGSGTGTGTGSGTGTGTGSGTGGTSSGNDIAHAWIDSLGTIADDLHLGVIGPALHLANIYDDLYRGDYRGALFDTSELIAGGLESSHIPVVSAFGVLIDVWAQAVQQAAKTAPSDPSVVFFYVIQHPISAFGGAVSAVFDVAGNTIGHMVGLPQPLIDGLVQPAVQGINDGSDTLQNLADTAVNGAEQVVQNVVNTAGNAFNNIAHGRPPWQN